jgi:5-methylcytosine-specific restriction endonuclease McrA
MTSVSQEAITIPQWLTYNDIDEHIYELDALINEAAKIIAEPTFHLLFSDREFLVSFQALVSAEIAKTDISRQPDLFQRTGILKRPRHLPQWLRKAVFLRDKGRCQSCFVDLTGTMALDPKVHLDHIVSLGNSGSNDATNFQLCYERCNLAKGSKGVGHIYRTFTFW